MLKPGTHFRILPCNLTNVYGVTVPFALVRFATRSIHSTVGFPASIEGCYITPLEQVCACFCARSAVENCFSSGPGHFSTVFFIFAFLFALEYTKL
jgi:hypothetical protein